MSVFERSVAGFFAPLKGLEYLFRHRLLWPHALIPYFVSAALAAAAIYVMIISVPYAVNALLPTAHSGPIYLLKLVVASMGYLMASVAALIGCYILLRLIAVPFYSFLAEKTLESLGEVTHSKTFREWLRETAFLMRVSILKTGLFLILGAGLFLVSLIPIINLVAVAMSLILFSFDCFDYALEAKKYGLKKRLQFFFELGPEILGLALSQALLFLIPGLNFLFFPATIVGATQIIFHQVRTQHDP